MVPDAQLELMVQMKESIGNGQGSLLGRSLDLCPHKEVDTQHPGILVSGPYSLLWGENRS